MSKRNVKTVAAALSRTDKPLVAADGLENVVAGLGTDRDKRSYTRYEFPRVLQRYELENMYRVSWLAKRIVNAVADDMTRKWRTFGMGDNSDAKKQKALETAERTFQVRAKINEALRWSRLYGGALIVLGIRGQEDTTKPLRWESLGTGCLRYMHVVDRWRVAPSGTIVTDLEDPDFGMPDFYQLAESGILVHKSRVLRFNGEKLPYFSWRQNAMWDDSVLQHVLDSLGDCDTTTRSIATMIFEANVDVVKSPVITELLAQKGGDAKVAKRFQVAAMLKSFNRMLLLDGEEEYEKKTNSFANLADIMEKFQIDVCGAADIPMTRLFGQSPGGLNATGDGDLENYYNMVNAKQEADLRPQLERLDEVLLRHVFGTKPEDITFTFDSLWQVSDKDQAAIDYQRAQTDQIYLQAGVVTEGLVASELQARGTYRTMDDEDVQLAEELAEASQELREEQHANMMENGGVPAPPAAPNKDDDQQGGDRPPKKGKEDA